jgi:stage II sporulation protein AA (anti-sigma F factor antagonist)
MPPPPRAQVRRRDSTSSNILIAAYQAATGAGGWIRLAGATDSVLYVLHIVGVDDISNATPPR